VKGRDPLVVLDDLIAALGEPLAKEDRAGGWNKRNRDRGLTYFRGLRQGLSADRVPEGAPYHLARWLDHDGIGEGPLAERVYDLQDLLHKRFANRNANPS